MINDHPDGAPIIPFGVTAIIPCAVCGEDAIRDFQYDTYPAIDVYHCRHGHQSEHRRTMEEEKRIQALNPYLYGGN